MEWFKANAYPMEPIFEKWALNIRNLLEVARRQLGIYRQVTSTVLNWR